LNVASYDDVELSETDAVVDRSNEGNEKERKEEESGERKKEVKGEKEENEEEK
jgi:hypothetical protein